MIARRSLVCHPSSRCDAVRGLEAEALVEPGGALALRYALDADLARLRLPPRAPARRVDGLWQHTCFEAFVAVDGQAAYCEFNLAPSSEWAAYRFHGYRDPAPAAHIEPPAIHLFVSDRRLELEAQLHPQRLLSIAPGARLRIGLSAVIEASDGTLSYWALGHAPGKPDFHRAEAFALALAVPEST